MKYLSRSILCCACRQNSATITITEETGKASICEDCAKELYPEAFEEMLKRENT